VESGGESWCSSSLLLPWLWRPWSIVGVGVATAVAVVEVSCGGRK
jgi:hypothetical protein